MDTIRTLQYIASEQCALLIGPDIMRFGERSMAQHLCDRLYDNYRDDIAFYYENEGFFLFHSQGDHIKADMAQDMRLQCQQLAFDEALYSKIARIPFHLVLSINPDTFLSDVCYKYSIRHRFGYFRSRQKGADVVAPPTREEPLFYNLAGYVHDDESLLLDYEDLFSLIASTVGSPGLPLALQEALHKVRTFVFLGFSFEKWYTQLLLRILCGDKRYQKYAIRHNIGEGATRNFLVQQFKIEFLSGDTQPLEALYQAAAQPGAPVSLRPVSDPVAEQVTNIIRHIQQYQPEKALDALLSATKGTALESDAAMFSGRYAKLREEKANGKLDSRDEVVEYNRIVDGILQAAKGIDAAGKV